MAKIYEQNTGPSPVYSKAAVDLSRCRAEIMSYMGRWPSWHQCNRKGVIECDGMLFCKQHSPEGEAKRDAEKKERDRLERLKYDRSAWRGRAFDIVRQIAEGHNDPMTLAREYMASEPK